MSKTSKIFCASLALILVLCLGLNAAGMLLYRLAGTSLAQALLDGSLRDHRAARSIADCTPPPGFDSLFTIDAGMFTAVSYTAGDDDSSHIFFFQLPSGYDLDRGAASGLIENIGGSVVRSDRLTVVDSFPTQIRGQEVLLTISESENHTGQPYREAFAAFEGRGGQALVLISRPLHLWDQQEVDRFLASIQ